MMFGKQLVEFVDTLNFCGLVVLVCACDYASTNATVVAWMRHILETCAVIVWVHYERCGLHQLACLIKDLTSLHSMSRQMRALGKTMRNRRNKQRFERELAKCVPPCVVVNGPQKGPCCASSLRWPQDGWDGVDVLREQSRASGGQDACSPGLGRFGCHQSRRDACLRSLFARCNNWDIASDPTLGVTETLITEEAVQKEITDDVLGVIFASGWEQYSDARWTKQNSRASQMVRMCSAPACTQSLALLSLRL